MKSHGSRDQSGSSGSEDFCGVAGGFARIWKLGNWKRVIVGEVEVGWKLKGVGWSGVDVGCLNLGVRVSSARGEARVWWVLSLRH
jgi:hypothetical protein